MESSEPRPGQGSTGDPAPPAAGGSRLSRRGTIARGTLAVASAWALAACGLIDDTEPVTAPAQHGDPELGKLEAGRQDWAVAGRQLNAGLLRSFYVRHGFSRVWATRPTEAVSLIGAVSRAGEHGLNPDLFHADLLLRADPLPPLHRELLLSDAFLSYADALARGAVPVERRGDGETLTPGPVDVAAALDAAIDSADPGAEIEKLAPSTPSYLALQAALRRQRSAPPPRGKAAPDRLREIEVNLERQRWLPRRLPADRVQVNVADQRLGLYRADRLVFTTRVVVGDEAPHKQSPEFRTDIGGIFFNPPWIVPADIVTAEILPRIARDPDYLRRFNMTLLPNGEVEQRAGPTAALGALMLDMPNRFDVYLHDTPNQQIFSRDNRRISHGCIRVENPRALAALLMETSLDAIDHAIAPGATTRQGLPVQVPVFLTYETAFADADGALQFRPDFYNRDAGIRRLLQGGAQDRTPMAQMDRLPADRPARPIPAARV